MITVNIKPLSVNRVWQGKRFKTPEYKKYETDVLLMLPNKIELPKSPLSLKLEFGVSSKLADIDNGVKPFLDILQKKYGINDRDIYHLQVLKTIVKKGQEFIKFKIE